MAKPKKPKQLPQPVRVICLDCDNLTLRDDNGEPFEVASRGYGRCTKQARGVSVTDWAPCADFAPSPDAAARREWWTNRATK